MVTKFLAQGKGLFVSYLDEGHALRLYCSDGFGPSVKKRFRHSWLICALYPPVQAEVRGLESHLHKSIGAEPVASDEVFAVTLELESLTVVLADQITQSCFSKTNAGTDLWSEGPLKFLGSGIDSVTWRR